MNEVIPKEQTTRYNEDSSWRYEIAEFVAAILGEGEILHGTVEDAYKTMELVFRIYAADQSWSHRWNISCQPQTPAAVMPRVVRDDQVCHFKSIIFDLDGTLINTAPDVRRALNHMLATYGQPEITSEEIYSYIGNGARAMIEKAFANSNICLQNDEIDKALLCYLDYYQAHPVVENKDISGCDSYIS